MLTRTNSSKNGFKYSIEHWNHYAKVLVDPDYPRTSNMVGGFHSVLYDICVNFNQYDSVLSYMFKVADSSGHKQ